MSLVFLGLSLQAQVAISDSATDPDASAMLDVTSTDKGVLIPRMTAIQRDAIESPATGLLIYNTDDAAFDYFDGDWYLVGEGVVAASGYFDASTLQSINRIESTVPSSSSTVSAGANETSIDSTATSGTKWQSFTATQTGTLALVQLQFEGTGSVTVSDLRIYSNTDPDSPFSGTLLHTQADLTGTAPWVELTLSPELSVVAGQRYFLVVTADGEWRFNNSGSDVYAGGRASTGAGLDDYAFRTFVRTSVQALAVDSTSGDVAIANGAIRVVGQGEGQVVFNAENGWIHAGVTDLPLFAAIDSGDYAVSFGHNVLASGENAFALGNEVLASGELSFAAGYLSEASGRLSLAIGNKSKATAQGSVAIGDKAIAGNLDIAGVSFPGLAVGAVAIGKNVTSKGLGAFAVGEDSVAKGTLSFALGKDALTEGENAIAAGNRAEAYGARSVAMGDRVKSYGNASMAFGLRNNAQSFGEFVVGSYTPDYTPQSTTAWNAADRLFVVGNGPDSSNRSTALIVYKNGDATLNGQLTLSNGSAGITFPNTDGAGGQVLVTDGDGTLFWGDRYSSDLYDITTVLGTWDGSVSADAGNEIGGGSLDLHEGSARQTFTAGQSGALQGVEVFLYTAGEPTPFTLDVYAGDYATGALPGTTLASQAFVVSVPGWAAITFVSGPELASDSVYTIVLSIGDTEAVGFWYLSKSDDPYDGGRASTDPTDDFLFRTALMVAEDVSLLALNQSSGEVSLGNGNVVIDSGASPDYALTVNGGLRVVNGTEASGYLAVSDANGSLLWVDPTSVATAPDGDGDASNELQSLSLSGTDLTLSDGGGTVDLAVLQTDLGYFSTTGSDPNGVAAISVESVGGHGVLDVESYEGYDYVDVSGGARQTFTAGQSGELDIVLVDLGIDGDPVPGTLEVYAGDYATGTLPVTPGISAAFTIVDTDNLYVPLDHGFDVTAGEVYTVVVLPAGTARWRGDFGSNSYAGGRASTGSEDDFRIKTYVTSNAFELISVDKASGEVSLNNGTLTLGAAGNATLFGDLTLTTSSNHAITYTSSPGSAGQVLTSNGAGGTSWNAVADSSSTNEIQTLSLSGTNLTLSKSGGTVSIADGDSDATNEIQTLSLSGTDLTLSSGGGTISINDADSSTSNELQTLSQSGGTVTLSNGGGSVAVPWTVSGSSISSTNSGNVGIGTTSPDTKLSVVGYVRAAWEATETNFTEIGHGGSNGFIRKWGEGNLDFRTQTGTWMSLTDDGELGIGTTDPSALLDVNGDAHISGGLDVDGNLNVDGTFHLGSGSPANGMVLTTDASGNGTWKYVSLNAGAAVYETTTSVAGSTTGWQNFGGTSAPLAGLTNGNKVMVMVSCRVRVGGTTGTDDYTFRIQGSIAATVNSTDTGLIENLDQDRNQWQLLSFHRVLSITTAGTYLFRMQVEMSNADDTIEIDQLEISAFKL